MSVNLVKGVSHLRSKSGMALINVMVATVIVGILVTALTTAIVQSMKENKFLEQKLVAMDLQRTMSTVAPGVNLCALSLEKNPQTIPVATLATTTLPLTDISLDAAGTHTLASVDPNPAVSGAMKVASIQISQMADMGGALIGNLVVSFISERPLKPLVYKVNLQTTLAGANYNLTGCSAAGDLNANPSPTPAKKVGQAECEAAGGTWVVPTTAGRPTFCANGHDVLEWY